MNKEEYLKNLERELKLLTEDELKKEISFYDNYFRNQENKNILFSETIESIGSPKDVAKKIYLKRGIETNKINENIVDKLIKHINYIVNIFNNNKNNKTKMIIDLVLMFIIIILLKSPFDLINDIGYDYIFLANPNPTYEKLWELLFLVLYTITAMCTFIVLIRNFIKKYK